MSVFKNTPEEKNRLDWKILQNGWTCLYLNPDVLNKDLNWFKTNNYEIAEIDCSVLHPGYSIHKELKRVLNFPDYYGENTNALSDCLSDLEINEPGYLIVFRNVQEMDIQDIPWLLDVFADNSRYHSLFGKILLTLVQVDDPKFHLKPIGAYTVSWNPSEWLNKNREL
jgi:RNAse (barnase) inhibitor barstar